ncbi:MAG: inositol monophosphatase [Actinomycetia bacterium]|nr:inositol monophosphatase [Actinomycetes bacterium]
MIPDVNALAALAATTASDVGAYLLQWRRDHRSVESDTKSGPTDVVTVADREAEAMIRRQLLAAYPEAAWWGEESGRHPGTGARSGQDLEWVVDPIDGTVNFLYDLPGWAVSIAAVWRGDVVAGAVMVPTTSTLFTAARGAGSWVDEGGTHRRLAVSECSELAQALIATGFAYDAATRVRQGLVLGRMVGRVRDIRRTGAASVDLCAVGAGRVDGYFERGLQPWDLAAGGLIAREAGAVVAERAGGSVVASGPGLTAEFEALLAEVDAKV